jgi:hypothetical protein
MIIEMVRSFKEKISKMKIYFKKYNKHKIYNGKTLTNSVKYKTKVTLSDDSKLTNKNETILHESIDALNEVQE